MKNSHKKCIQAATAIKVTTSKLKKKQKQQSYGKPGKKLKAEQELTPSLPPLA